RRPLAQPADLLCAVGSFFFSSRRRHTSFSRDWSSDVCSSDLSLLRNSNGVDHSVDAQWLMAGIMDKGIVIPIVAIRFSGLMSYRSEERRVGNRASQIVFHSDLIKFLKKLRFLKTRGLGVK